MGSTPRGSVVREGQRRPIWDLLALPAGDFEIRALNLVAVPNPLLETAPSGYELDLLGADLTDAGLELLSGMTKLQELNLYRTKVTNTGLARLGEGFCPPNEN